MFRHFVNIHGQHLNSYSYSSGGGMDGGYYSETVKRVGDHAIICIESAEWYAKDPTVKEYQVDAAILDEIESIVRKQKMNFWNHKKFSRMFIFDAASESYSFDFDDRDISFSSQVYPVKYQKKLSELDHVVERYTSSGELLPGLVNPLKDDEAHYELPENELFIYVCLYAGDLIKLRVLNGTEEAVELSETYQLLNADTNEVLLEDEHLYGTYISERSRDEMELRLKERLNAGNYKLFIGDLEIPFEIR